MKRRLACSLIALCGMVSTFAFTTNDALTIFKVKPGAAVPDLLTAGLFDEHWELPK